MDLFTTVLSPKLAKNVLLWTKSSEKSDQGSGIGKDMLTSS
jgi:hypothetical protein